MQNENHNLSQAAHSAPLYPPLLDENLRIQKVQNAIFSNPQQGEIFQNYATEQTQFQDNKTVQNLHSFEPENFDNFQKTQKNTQFFDKKLQKNEENANFCLKIENLMKLLQGINDPNFLSTILEKNLGTGNANLIETLSKISALSKTKNTNFAKNSKTESSKNQSSKTDFSKYHPSNSQTENSQNSNSQTTNSQDKNSPYSKNPSSSSSAKNATNFATTTHNQSNSSEETFAAQATYEEL